MATTGLATAVGHKTIALGLLAAWLFGLPALLHPRWDELVGVLGGPYHAYARGIFITHMAVMLAGNAFFLAAYANVAGLGDLLAPWKISRKAWPWHQGPEQRAAFFDLVKKAIALTLFNDVCLGFPLTYLNYGTAVKYGYSAAATDLPSPLTVLASVAAFVLIEDVIFYHTHRALHAVPFLYRNVHKLHHKYYYSVSIAAEFAHPVEFILGNAVPFAAGPLLLGAHLYTWIAWTVFRIGETIYGHSGYDFPFSPLALMPFAAGSSAHDAHHSRNTGNYESFLCLLDRLYGTHIPEETVAPASGGGAANVAEVTKPAPAAAVDADGDPAPVASSPGTNGARVRSRKVA